MSTITGLVIATNGTVTELELPTSKAEMQTALENMVGGDVQAVDGYRFEYDITLFVHEDGKGKGVEPNPLATVIMTDTVPSIRADDFIIGPMVMVGRSDDGDAGLEYLPLHHDVIKYVREMEGPAVIQTEN